MFALGRDLCCSAEREGKVKIRVEELDAERLCPFRQFCEGLRLQISGQGLTPPGVQPIFILRRWEAIASSQCRCSNHKRDIWF
jgi:hypothetical protein